MVVYIVEGTPSHRACPKNYSSEPKAVFELVELFFEKHGLLCFDQLFVLQMV